jgi:mRNA interferase MazF
MGKIKYVPARGDIVWIDFDPTKGHEQRGRRPALVISPEKYNALSHRAIFCPITSKSKKYPFEVFFEGESITGAVLADQVRTMDFTKRNIEFIEKVSLSVMEHIEAKLLVLIKG